MSEGSTRDCDNPAISTPELTWRLDPLIISSLVAYLAIYFWRFRLVRSESGSRGAEWWRAALFVSGVGLLAIALISPLDELGERYLFSAHMLQHLLIGDIAPLLVLLGLSRVIMRPATRRLMRFERALGPFAHPFTALVLWIALLYGWHIPVLYDAALRYPLVHGLEHASFLIGGFLLWWPLIQPVPMRRALGNGAQFAYVGITKLALAALGIFFVWSSTVVYDFYVTAPRISGLTPLTDQKTGGALMMAEQSIVLASVFFALFIRMLAKSEEDQVRRERLEDAAAETAPLLR
ncbi:MAG: cytochrome c oxidase assembly protein [Thermoleophilaceae bacterium]|nr:cytochrome c oxidase assembly protein [Thermoleophilaceae bacterium]